MSSKHTPNYNLSQWERTDKVLMDDFNADNAKIDGAIAGKADVSALTALEQRVDSKADASALTNLSQTVAGQAAAIAKLGNCRIYFSTYVGTGSYSSTRPQKYTFPGTPLFVVVGSGEQMMFALRGVTSGMFARRSTTAELPVSWSGNSMSISSTSAMFEFNVENTHYNIMALIAADE